jgi:bifunctional non-homologous end joining protein LigD
VPRREIELEVDGRSVTISNPEKVFFAEHGYTKLDLVRYYLAVAEGALRGAGGRPMALKRFVNGAAGEFFFQKRAPESRPDWVETVELSFPSGRTAHEIVVRDAAQLAWVINLGCIDLNPHPVRADDLDHPDELRVDLDPVPGVPWSQVREVALVTRGVLDDHSLVGWPKTSGSRGIHINVRIERRWEYGEVRRAALALAREVERRAPQIATSKWWKEERHGVFLDYNQNAKDRTVASAWSVRPLPDARVSMPLAWDEVADVEPADFTLATVPAIFARRGDPHAGIDAAVGSLDALLELSARHEAEGLGDAPWPPNYRKQAGEPPRVQPSRQRRDDADYDTPEAEAKREKARIALERRLARAPERRAAEQSAGEQRGAERPGDAEPAPLARPTGRRRSTKPLVEIARAARKDEALAGLERWKARHEAVVPFLQPADVLVDAMRGRATTWTRIRVNLEHVPEQLRPAQEPLEIDYDPWAAYEWPDRSGQLERAPRRRAAESKPADADAGEAERPAAE